MKKVFKIIFNVIEAIFAVFGLVSTLAIIWAIGINLYTGNLSFPKFGSTKNAQNNTIEIESTAQPEEKTPQNTKKEIKEITYENITDDPYRGQNGSILRIETTDEYEIVYRKFETPCDKDKSYYSIASYTASNVEFHSEPSFESDIVFSFPTNNIFGTFYMKNLSPIFKTTEIAYKTNFKKGGDETWLKGSVEALDVKDSWLYCGMKNYYYKEEPSIFDSIEENLWEDFFPEY